ncbi:MAG: MarR family winged helix-turn-helix transcriptional regulator, partial [Bacilli bacterium]
MDAKAKAEEFFETIVKRKKSLIEIPLNCSQGETGALLYLTFVKNGITSSELAGILNVSLPRVVSLLNSLESKNLVEKLIDREDKRKTIVNITDVGKELVLSKKEEAINRITKVIEKLDEED